MGRILLVILSLVQITRAEASSCCGQTPTSFMVLSLDQKLSVTTSYSFLQTQGRVLNSDEFYIWNDKSREVQSIQLNVASTLATGHQIFLTGSLLQGIYQDQYSEGRASHLSDTQLGYSYELVPEYSFSYWKPIVYLSAIVNLPTGKSIYDPSSLSEGADVTGHNQWGGGLGVTVRKVYFPWTLTAQSRILRILPARVGQTDVSGFYDISFSFLANYQLGFQDVGVNFGVAESLLTSRKIARSLVSSGEMKNTALMFGLQKSFGEVWMGGVSYSDQTLIGDPRNTLLNRTLSIYLNYNYF